jgi:ribonuclease Z
MEAEHILLTHFSARYPKMPPIEAGTAMPDEDPATLDYSDKQDSRGRSRTPPAVIARRRKPVIAVAFDHLNVTIGEMWKINHYLPAIEQSFLDTLEEGDDEVDESGAQEVA